uniref:G2/M-phase specific E3 ubiquitin protein ligase n=1 Tax=Sphaeramia orbicularis TaxID=375764 RepID=A0A673CCC7_9TELE
MSPELTCVCVFSVCALCRLSVDDPALFGEKVKLSNHKLSVHYFCLLTSCGIYQRGQEDEGVFGFLEDDIKQEMRRSGRLKCIVCKKKGACVGCYVSSCKKVVHFPCGRQHQFISQFTGDFPSYCPSHGPSQSLGPGGHLDISLPRSCSVCLDSIDPILSYSVLKCPSCHTSWFHRDCVQRQAHSAGLFFFRCTLCNNKDQFQEEMLRMGIYIPERDASWELETNAYSELLEVYRRCDAVSCICDRGRTHSARSGWFEVIRCSLCGSKGTHRKCSGLTLETRDWACSDCTQVTDGQVRSCVSLSIYKFKPLFGQKIQSLTVIKLICRVRPSLPIGSGSPQDLLKALVPQLRPLSVQVEARVDKVLTASLDLVRRTDFDPTHTLSVSSLRDSDVARQYFFQLLLQQIQDSPVFEGPDGSKNLALDYQALKDDLYYDVGCLLALCLVHGGLPVGFFSRGLFQCLFNFPPNRALTAKHMTPGTHFTHQISEVQSLVDLQEALDDSWEYLALAGCNRPISSLEDRDALVEDLVSFTMITRMQLPLQRFGEGLQTLGVFDQVQVFPSLFCSVFCDASEPLTAQTLNQLFSARFSSQHAERLSRETAVVGFWKDFLSECEVGQSSVSLQDVLRFSTGADQLTSAGLLPPPSISFLHPPGDSGVDAGLFPQSDPGCRRLLLPVTSSYQAFKSSMEQAISHHTHLHPPRI